MVKILEIKMMRMNFFEIFQDNRNGNFTIILDYK